MRKDISFSIFPQGMNEIFDVMVKAVPEEPFEVFSSTWSKVQHCLDAVAEWVWRMVALRSIEF